MRIHAPRSPGSNGTNRYPIAGTSTVRDVRHSPFPFASISRVNLTAQDQVVVPATEIAHHLQVGRARHDPGAVAGGERSWETPKHSVHRHQIIRRPRRSDVADARPLRVPTMRAVIGVTGFRQAI